MATAPPITRSGASTWRLNRAITNNPVTTPPLRVITVHHLDRATTNLAAHRDTAGVTTASEATMAIAAITAATIAAIVDGVTTAVAGTMAEATAVVVETGEAGIADTQVRLNTDRAHRSAWACLP
ncbi:hypothetical protein AO065_19850 [Pseudomonas viridiflava]|nr:hypothetical protein AO065_19850 [Pseudomonas viridiflava]